MSELLLKIRVVIKRIFTPILRLAFTPLNNIGSFAIKEFLDCLIQCGDICLVLVNLGFKIGPFAVSNQ